MQSNVFKLWLSPSFQDVAQVARAKLNFVGHVMNSLKEFFMSWPFFWVFELFTLCAKLEIWYLTFLGMFFLKVVYTIYNHQSRRSMDEDPNQNEPNEGGSIKVIVCSKRPLSVVGLLSTSLL